MKILVTGGAGFIGSNLLRLLVREKGCAVVNLDKLSYAANLESLAGLADHPNYYFQQADLSDSRFPLSDFLEEHKPDAVIHLAAESHVDRSIDAPDEFIQSNIVGTYNLLQASLAYYRSESGKEKAESFRFLHVSTDEVFGSLASDASSFSETSAYDPHSPYSASKAAADHLVHAWHHTYGLPVLLTNSSNNYGPYQFPEKLIPLVILKCLRSEPIPVYGAGQNIRDWLYVGDHCEALYAVLTRGRVGETYNIGGKNEQRNIDLVKMICRIMDEHRVQGAGVRGRETGSRSQGAGSRRQGTGFREQETGNRSQGTGGEGQVAESLMPDASALPPDKIYESLISFVNDRPGHDYRYALDITKIGQELRWQPKMDFGEGLRDTVQWYLNHQDFWKCAKPF